MTRRMSDTRRARIFEASKGICHICGHKIDGTREAWDAEHIVPYALTRDDSDENLAPAHKACHAAKTSDDVTRIAKAKRGHRKHIGAHQPKSKILGSKGTGLRKRMDGTVVRVKE